MISWLSSHRRRRKEGVCNYAEHVLLCDHIGLHVKVKVIKLILWCFIEVHIKHIIVLYWLYGWAVGMGKAHRQGVLWLVYLRLHLGVARTIAKNSSSMPMRSMFFCLNLNNYECWIHSVHSFYFFLVKQTTTTEEAFNQMFKKWMCCSPWLRMNKINPHFIILELF